MNGEVSGQQTGQRGRTRERDFSKAQRNSTRVRLLKVVIPLGTALAAALLLAVVFLDPFGRLPEGVKVGAVSLSGTKITMESPHLTGYRKDSRGYEVTADNAYQDVRKPTVIELERMKARFAMDAAGKMAHLVSDTGVFDTQKEQLELRQNIRVTTDDGQEITLKSASIDMKGGTVVSNEPVRVVMQNGVVEADSLRVIDSGKTIVFSGRVRTVLDPAASDQTPKRQTQAPDLPAAATPAGSAR